MISNITLICLCIIHVLRKNDNFQMKKIFLLSQAEPIYKSDLLLFPVIHMPMQYTVIFAALKMTNMMKKNDIFLIFAQNKGCW